MKNNSKSNSMMSSVRRMVLLMLAGASVGLVLTDTMTRVQSAMAEIRATYQPCMRTKVTGNWTCGHVAPTVMRVKARVAAARRIL